MENFIRSLTTEQRLAMGRYLVNAMQQQNNFDSALRQAIGNLLLDCLLGYDSEGFFDYVSTTARQVVEGVYGSIDEIREEFDRLIKEESDE
jgi:hypothetical protein